jgi:hypothetical protein
VIRRLVTTVDNKHFTNLRHGLRLPARAAVWHSYFAGTDNSSNGVPFLAT